MTLNEIKTAVRDGKQVHWATSTYEVINPIKSPTFDENVEQWLIRCKANDHCIGSVVGESVPAWPDRSELRRALSQLGRRTWQPAGH